MRAFRREREARVKQAFVPLQFDPGQAFQFDWGLEEVEIAGQLLRVKAARIKLCHSRYSLVVIYPNERLKMDDTNSYSVECAYVGLSVQVKAYAWEVSYCIMAKA